MIRWRDCSLLNGVQASYLHLSIGPSRHFDNHVENGLFFIGVEWDVVERRERDAILFDVDAVLEGVGGTNLAWLILGSHAGCCYEIDE